MPYNPVPRLKGFSYTGLKHYSLTICVDRRRHVFVNRDAVDLVTAELVRTYEQSRFAVIAYCFMPDHLHLLVEAVTDQANLPAFVRLFKQCSAFHWKARYGEQLWQRSYFEHVLREGESPVKAARYLLANPVRAGLVERPEDYPFVGSATMTVRHLLYSITQE